MVVKSATKKRLTELGVREELAHKLATDRNMAAIKQMSSDDIAKACGLSRDDEELQTVLNVLQEVGSKFVLVHHFILLDLRLYFFLLHQFHR